MHYDENKWVGVEANFFDHLSHYKLRPRAVKVYVSAMARVDRNGHSHYAPNELALILGTDNNTGEQRAVAKSAAANAVRIAKEDGLILEDSSVRCIKPLGLRQGTGVRNAITCYHNR